MRMTFKYPYLGVLMRILPTMFVCCNNERTVPENICLVLTKSNFMAGFCVRTNMRENADTDAVHVDNKSLLVFQIVCTRCWLFRLAPCNSVFRLSFETIQLSAVVKIMTNESLELRIRYYDPNIFTNSKLNLHCTGGVTPEHVMSGGSMCAV